MGFEWIGEPMPCYNYLEVLPTPCRFLLSPPMISIQGQNFLQATTYWASSEWWNLIWNSIQSKQYTHTHHQRILESPFSFLSITVEWEYLYCIKMMNMTYEVLSHNSSSMNTFQLPILTNDNHYSKSFLISLNFSWSTSITPASIRACMMTIQALRIKTIIP